MLHFTPYGNSDKTPLVIAHGLFGSARNWTAISKRLSAERPVIAADLRNHGASVWSPSHSYRDLAEDLALLIDGTGERCDVLGHSMGGKAAMVLALTHPHLVRKLIVVDIAPVAYEHTQAPLIKAMQSLDLAHVTTRRDADEQLAETVCEPEIRAFLLQSLDLKGDAPRWVLNLDVLEANMEKIMSFPAIEAQFNGPVLLLKGGESAYVRDSHNAPLRSAFPKIELREIVGAGHWIHADNPREFIAAVRAFLAR